MARLSGTLTLIAGLAALAGALWWLQSDRETGPAGPPRPPYVLPVSLTEVRRGDLSPRLELTGSVRSARNASLAFERPGTVVALEADEGQTLERGALVARLDDADERLALSRADADLAVARRTLETLEAGTRVEVVARLEAELEGAQADEELARLETERLQPLLASEDVTRSELDRAQAAWRSATARRRAAEERLAEARAGTRAEELAVARAQVDVALAAREQALRDLAETELRAPWTGSVVRRQVSVGDVLAAGDAVVELVDPIHLEVEVEVPSDQALALGSRPAAVLRLDEKPGFALDLHLDELLLAADSVSRNFRSLARLTADEATRAVLRPGMFVRLSVELAALEDVLLVDADAVRVTDQGTLVAPALPADAGAPSPLQAGLVPVRVLAEHDGTAAVEPLDGALSPGDQVVLVGVDLTYPGVPLLPRGGEPAAPEGEAP